MADKIRIPVVAGQFYEAGPQALIRQIEGLAPAKAQPAAAIACMVPHAGYVYSGKVAAATLASIKIPDKIILLGPNHTGNGEAFSLMAKGAWQTPLGNVRIDEDLALALLEASGHLDNDEAAHLQEHSLEVELPLLQYFKRDFTIVPIAFMTRDMDALKDVGVEIAAVIKARGLTGKVLIVASSDMTHYEPHDTAMAKDNKAIEAITKLDERLLIDRVEGLDISMCGICPAVAMITASKALGAKKAELIMYQTSADATADKTSVVGYAGIKIS